MGSKINVHPHEGPATCLRLHLELTHQARKEDEDLPRVPVHPHLVPDDASIPSHRLLQGHARPPARGQGPVHHQGGTQSHRCVVWREIGHELSPLGTLEEGADAHPLGPGHRPARGPLHLEADGTPVLLHHAHDLFLVKVFNLVPLVVPVEGGIVPARALLPRHRAANVAHH